ncbi:MAG TPA: Mur ligase domain-containing protein, partial [Trueperaceae bacterium]
MTTQQTKALAAPATLAQMRPENARLHFVGVGGISMQALALWCRHDGFEVSGCDPAMSAAARADLGAAGVRLHDHHDAAHAGDVEVVVHSMAVPVDHAELSAARAAGALVVRRIELLGELFRRRRAIG